MSDRADQHASPAGKARESKCPSDGNRSTEFRDYAASERTFLAWIRTAIALMALGFLVVRFGVYRISADPWALSHTTWFAAAGIGAAPGLVLIGIGIALAIASLHRFRATGRAIRNGEQTPPTTFGLETLLIVGIIASGVYLAVEIG